MWDPTLGAADMLALRQRIVARAPSTDSWRGFSVSLPFLPGAGEGAEAGVGVGLARLGAAAEAASGSWLRELEAALSPGSGTTSGQALSNIAAPGLASGAFGAWRHDECSEEILGQRTSQASNDGSGLFKPSVTLGSAVPVSGVLSDTAASGLPGPTPHASGTIMGHKEATAHDCPEVRSWHRVWPSNKVGDNCWQAGGCLASAGAPATARS